MNKKIICVGLDLGNSHVKAFSDVKEDGLILPNYIARKSEFESEMDLQDSYDLHEYESHLFEGERYVWGEDIHLSQHPLSSYTAQDRYESKPYRLLVDFTLTELVGESDEMIEVVLVTGCPSSEKGSKRLEEQLKKAFVGTKVIKRNGKEVMIKVLEGGFGVLAQPVGTLMNLYLDDTGAKVVRPEFFEEKIAILDIGGGTTDADLLVRMSPVIEKRESIKLGMNYAYERIADWINRENPSANASPTSVERQLRDGSNTYKISSRRSMDIKEIKEKTYTELAENIINRVNQRWRERDSFDRIILTGGGAEALFPYFKQWEKDVDIVEDSQKGNALGFLKFARRQMNKIVKGEMQK